MISVRRRPALLVLVLALVLGVAATAAGAVALRARAPQEPQPVQSAHRAWAAGPSATYEGDSGGIGVVRPLRVAVPDGTYDAVVTVSFDYRTRGPGPYETGLDLDRADAVPDSHALPGAASSTPTTVRYLLADLEGGRTYAVAPAVNSTSPAHGTNRIATRHVLVTVDLTPSD
ncbi:hypothetical protein [Nocardioides sp.]|uniref:hypothetical protein n=1 Tax=Nocardioides sp. TaxID=35761 RepID=UPI0037832449